MEVLKTTKRLWGELRAYRLSSEIAREFVYGAKKPRLLTPLGDNKATVSSALNSQATVGSWELGEWLQPNPNLLGPRRGHHN